MSTHPISSGVLRIAAFTTNADTISPLSIIRQIIDIKCCTNCKYIKEHHIQFDYYLLKELVLSIHCAEFISIGGEACLYEKEADLILVFVDLEQDDYETYLEEIVNHMKEWLGYLKRINIWGVYMRKESRKVSEEGIEVFLREKEIAFDYFENGIDDNETITRQFEFLVQEVLDNKNVSSKQELPDYDVSNSKCSLW